MKIQAVQTHGKAMSEEVSSVDVEVAERVEQELDQVVERSAREARDAEKVAELWAITVFTEAKKYDAVGPPYGTHGLEIRHGGARGKGYRRSGFLTDTLALGRPFRTSFVEIISYTGMEETERGFCNPLIRR